VVGHGGFATVHRARWQSSTVAIKMLSVQVETKAMNEANLLASLRHPCICSFYGTCVLDTTVCLVLEYMEGGTLAQFLYHTDGAEQPTTYAAIMGASASQGAQRLLRLSLQVADGLRFLHSNDIAHRDVKCSNVLLDATQSQARVADFGLSRIIPATRPDVADSEGERTISSASYAKVSSCGTLRYLPAESPADGEAAASGERWRRWAGDIYSYGFLLYEVLHGAMAFSELTPYEAFFAAAKGARPPINLESLPAEYHGLSSVIEQCWRSRSEERPPSKEVVTTLLSLLQHLEHGPEAPTITYATPGAFSDVDRKADPRIGMTGISVKRI